MNENAFGYTMFRTTDAFTPVDGVVISTKRCKIHHIHGQRVANQTLDFYNQPGGALVAGNLKRTVSGANNSPPNAYDVDAFFPKGCVVKASSAGVISVTFEEFGS